MAAVTTDVKIRAALARAVIDRVGALVVQVLAGRQEARAGVLVTERATVPPVMPEPLGWENR